jgi:hypothetical protein
MEDGSWGFGGALSFLTFTPCWGFPGDFQSLSVRVSRLFWVDDDGMVLCVEQK